MPWHSHRTGPGRWCIIEPNRDGTQRQQLVGILWITQAEDYCGFQPAHPTIDATVFDQAVAEAATPADAYQHVKAQYAPDADDITGILDTWARQ